MKMKYRMILVLWGLNGGSLFAGVSTGGGNGIVLPQNPYIQIDEFDSSKIIGLSDIKSYRDKLDIKLDENQLRKLLQATKNGHQINIIDPAKNNISKIYSSDIELNGRLIEGYLEDGRNYNMQLQPVK